MKIIGRIGRIGRIVDLIGLIGLIGLIILCYAGRMASPMLNSSAALILDGKD